MYLFLPVVTAFVCLFVSHLLSYSYYFYPLFSRFNLFPLLTWPPIPCFTIPSPTHYRSSFSYWHLEKHLRPSLFFFYYCFPVFFFLRFINVPLEWSFSVLFIHAHSCFSLHSFNFRNTSMPVFFRCFFLSFFSSCLVLFFRSIFRFLFPSLAFILASHSIISSFETHLGQSLFHLFFFIFFFNFFPLDFLSICIPFIHIYSCLFISQNKATFISFHLLFFLLSLLFFSFAILDFPIFIPFTHIHFCISFHYFTSRNTSTSIIFRHFFSLFFITFLSPFFHLFSIFST